jgi:hypothetical protein
VDGVAFSVVACTLPPTIPLAVTEFAGKQKAVAERDLPGWNPTNMAGNQAGGGLPLYHVHGNPAQAVILQSLLLQQVQSQGTTTPTRHVKKPSEQWEATIDLLLQLMGITREADSPPIWDAWANCNKKEAHAILQEHL